MALLKRRHLAMIMVAASAFVIIAYLLSQLFDFVIALYTSTTTALAIALTLEVRHGQQEKIRYKNTVGIPSLRRSLRYAFVSLLDIRSSIVAVTHPSMFNAQIINVLQKLHHIRAELLRYSVEGALPDTVELVIHRLGSPTFLASGGGMKQNDELLGAADQIIRAFSYALEEFNELYK